MTTANKKSFYKTAIVKCNIYTHNGENDIRAGSFVSVTYAGERWNQLFRREESIFYVAAPGNKIQATLYEGALTGFCL